MKKKGEFYSAVLLDGQGNKLAEIKPTQDNPKRWAAVCYSADGKVLVFNVHDTALAALWEVNYFFYEGLV